MAKIRKHKIKCVVTFWKALWHGAERVQAEGFHPGLDASWDALESERFKKKIEKKLTNVSFMYVCVAGNGEMLVFFSFFPPTIV